MTTQSLTLESFYPDNLIKCKADLPFDDGTYEVWEGNSILNIFEIKNKRIIFHYKYNVSMKLRLITWHFEYLTAEDGSQICNIWRQCEETTERDLFHSTHWHLYPEVYKARMEQKNRWNTMWNKFVLNTLNSSPQFDGKLTEVDIDKCIVR
jgi:hypothetical protein